jgi:hypothetical protein
MNSWKIKSIAKINKVRSLLVNSIALYSTDNDIFIYRFLNIKKTIMYVDEYQAKLGLCIMW